MKRFIALILLTVTVSSTLFAHQTSALTGNDFNAGRIIDDSIFFDPSGMSIDTIQAFLNSKVPVCDTYHSSSNPSYQPPFTCLKDYRQDVQGKAAEPGLCNDVSAGNKSSAEIIFEVSQSCGVSPKALIVLLEKEQGLVTDTWPWSIQYQSATGYGCPDNAPCDAEYYGFFNQLYNAARQFKKYARDESQFRYRAYRSNYIQYNPDTSCGGSNVVIENQATAGLYNYTPYQPNNAARAAAPGQTVLCGAYGNINFWRYFNNWFGPTTGEGFALMTSGNDNGDMRQWVVYKGKRQYVPSAEILRAWRLDQVPLIQVTGLYLGAIPTDTQSLNRLMRPPNSLDVYFVDNGKCYRVVSPAMLDAWGLNPAAIVDVSTELAQLPVNSGPLSYTTKNIADASGAIYMVDGGVNRQYQSPDVLSAWEGTGLTHTTLSADYFSAMGTGSSIGNTKVTSGAQGSVEYQVVAGQKLAQTSGVAQLYPGVAQTVSVSTISRLVTSSPASQFVQATGTQTTYLVDASAKHEVSSINILRAWSSGYTPLVNIVTQGSLNLLPTGAPVTGYEADVAGQLYLLDGRKVSVPAELDGAYRTTANVFSASPALLSLYSDGGVATNFLKGSASPAVYLIDRRMLRNIGTPNQLTLWGGANSIVTLSDNVLTQFSSGSTIGVYVSDGTDEYIVEGGKLHEVYPSSVKAAWGLSSPVMLDSTTISRLEKGDNLGTTLQNSGKYYVIINGKAYMTVDQNIAEVWNSKNAPSMNTGLTQEFLTTNTLTRFISASTDTRLFIVDNNILYHLSPEEAANFGLTPATPVMKIDPSAFTITGWGSPVVDVVGDGVYVVDGGGKRTFPNPESYNWWTSGTTPTTVTKGFVNLLPLKGIVDRAIKGTGPSVYDVRPDSGVISKHWVTNPNTFKNQYGRYEQVSDALINVLPTGSPVN